MTRFAAASSLLLALYAGGLHAGAALAQTGADAPEPAHAAPGIYILIAPEPQPDAAAEPRSGLRTLIDQHHRGHLSDDAATTWRLNPQQRAEMREQLRQQSPRMQRTSAPVRAPAPTGAHPAHP